MEIKKGDKFKIEHNWKIFLIIIGLLMVLGFVVYVSFQGNANQECIKDEDCVPASCCHASGCVPINESPDCSGVMCTMVCSGPLDCGAGHCGCVDGECKIISDE